MSNVLHCQINLIAPPLYVMTTSTLERTEGLATLNKAIASIKLTIEEAGGIFNIHKQVLVTTTVCLELYAMVCKLTSQSSKEG